MNESLEKERSHTNNFWAVVLLLAHPSMPVKRSEKSKKEEKDLGELKWKIQNDHFYV